MWSSGVGPRTWEHVLLAPNYMIYFDAKRFIAS
jgi:hypothetical protein